MKNFNLLRKSERKSVGTTLALTVGSPSFDRRGTMLKHLTFMLLFLLGSLSVWGDPVEIYKNEGSSGTTSGVEATGNVNTNSSNGNPGSSFANTSSKNTTFIFTGFNVSGYTDLTLSLDVAFKNFPATTNTFPYATITFYKNDVVVKTDNSTISWTEKVSTYSTKTISNIPNFDKIQIVCSPAIGKTGKGANATNYGLYMDNITLTGTSAGGGGGGTLSHTWDLSTNSYIAASTDQVTWSSTKDVENAEVKMIVEKGTAGTAANDYLGGTNSHTSSRFYQNSILKIMHTSDVTITSVVFTATTEADATALQKSDWTNAADATASGTTVTVTPNDPIVDISAPIGETCDFTGVTVYYTKGAPEPEPVIVKTLKSIAVEGMTTTFEQGDVFKFDGTCTATYSVTKDGVPQADETAEVTPTSVSTPDMSTTGEKEITVTYTENEVTKTASYNITVNPHVITPGEYKITLANAFWGTSGTGANAGHTASGVQKDISISITGNSGTQNYINDSETRIYGSHTLTFNVPTGYVLTKITGLGTTTKSDISAVSTGNISERVWTGSANSVSFTINGRTDFTTVSVTFEAEAADAPSVTINPTEVNATAEAVNGSIDVTYTNITTASATVGLFNDAECTEAFTGDWLEATLNGDKDIEYTIAANTGAARTAYIKLTAPASNGTSPDVVKIIEVSQAKGIPTYTALNAIFAAATGTNETVNITFDNWVISAVKGNNAYLTDGTYGLIIYTEGHGFEVGNVLSGTAQTLLKLYQGNAQLSGLMTTTTGLTVTKGGTVTARVLDAAAVDALTGANAGSLIKISGECTKESSKYYIQGIQLYNSLYSYEEPTAGNVYDCTGIFLMFNSTKEICPHQEGDLVPSAVTPTAVITFEDFSIEKGQNTTLAATVAPAVAASAEVTYSIVDGGEYVSLKGATLTANEIGTAHIRATVADDLPNYYGATKDITVTVTAPDSRKTAVINGITAVSGTLVTETAGAHKDKEYISYAAKRGGAANAPVIPSGKSFVRIYQNGGYLAINAVKGCLIDEVIVSIPTGCNSTTIAVGTDEENLPTTDGTAATAGNNFSTGTGLNSQNVYLVCLGTTKSTRLEVGAITVKYNGDPLAIDHYFLGGTYETTFEKNGTFDYTGLEVYAAYDAGETITEPVEGFTVEADLSTAGEKKAEVYLNEVRIAEYNITVTAGKENPALAYDPVSETITAGDAWSAPTLSNTFNVSPITYSSDKESVATVTSEGVITLAGGYGTAVITAHFDESEAYNESEATYTITVNKPAATPTSTVYRKVTKTADITDGEYLIVYEGDATHDAAVFDGSLDNVDQAMKALAVEIVNDEIAGNTDLDAATFTIDVTTGTLKSASGWYIGRTDNSNGLDKSKSEAYVNTFAITDDAAVITGVGNCTLRYNATSGQERFRYYKSGQQAVQLYKKVVTPPTPDYGSYQRTITAGNYGTICLPQAGTIEGATLFEIGSFENNIIYVDEVIDGVMAAGKPYIFQATADQLNVTYTSATVEQTAGNANGLHGFYNLNNENATLPLADNASLGNYILYQNAYWLVSGRAAYIANYRAYIKISEIQNTPAPEPTPGQAPRRRVAMSVHGEQVATGVENVQGDNGQCIKVLINGELFILRGEKMYDAKGQLVK